MNDTKEDVIHNNTEADENSRIDCWTNNVVNDIVDDLVNDIVSIDVNNSNVNSLENTLRGDIIIDETDSRLVNLRYLNDEQLLAWAKEEGNVYIGRRQDRLQGVSFKWQGKVR